MINTIKNINHNNPAVFGPILWDEYGQDAAECNTEIEQKFFCKRMRRRQKKLPCHSCSEEFAIIIKNHPPEDLVWTRTPHGQEYAMLYWVWLVHNMVNVRLGKEPIVWEVCYLRFTTEVSVPCMKENCGSETLPEVEDKSKVESKNEGIIIPHRNPARIIARRG